MNFDYRDESVIEVTKVGQRDSSYDDFLVDLNVTSENEECGYGLYDLEYMHQCEGTDNPYPVSILAQETHTPHRINLLKQAIKPHAQKRRNFSYI